MNGNDLRGASNRYFQIAEDVSGSAGTIIVLIALINGRWGCSLAGDQAAVVAVGGTWLFTRLRNRRHPMSGRAAAPRWSDLAGPGYGAAADAPGRVLDA